jgi:hypothetical protein
MKYYGPPAIPYMGAVVYMPGIDIPIDELPVLDCPERCPVVVVPGIIPPVVT